MIWAKYGVFYLRDLMFWSPVRASLGLGGGLSLDWWEQPRLSAADGKDQLLFRSLTKQAILYHGLHTKRRHFVIFAHGETFHRDREEKEFCVRPVDEDGLVTQTCR